MDRLQKKCFIVTAGCHGLLILVLLFGSALMPASSEETNVKLFNVINLQNVTDDGPSTGGSPDVKVPAAQNPTPKPAEPTPAPPTPKPEPRPEPPAPKPQKIETPKPREIPEERTKPEKVERVPEPRHKLSKDDLIPAEPKHTQTKHQPKFSAQDFTPARRTAADKKQSEKEAADAEAERQARAERAARRRAAKEFSNGLASLNKNLSSKTLVDMSPGPGGGGEVSANYRDLIASKYYNAWILPVGVDEEVPSVTVSVTIARSGEVVSARIIKGSGNKLMDRSVQNALESVTFIAPFPESSHDQERTINLHFNPQAKRQLG